jgi:hypothetical protein
MAESDSHRRAKSKAAGQAGRTEAPLRGNRRLDALTPRKAIEIERSGTMAVLEKAAKRLKDSGRPQKVLQVPQKDMAKAAKAMQNVGISGTIKNMGGTKRRSVKKK